MGKQVGHVPRCRGVTSPARTDLRTCIPRALLHASPSPEAPLTLEVPIPFLPLGQSGQGPWGPGTGMTPLLQAQHILNPEGPRAQPATSAMESLCPL